MSSAEDLIGLSTSSITHMVAEPDSLQVMDQPYRVAALIELLPLLKQNSIKSVFCAQVFNQCSFWQDKNVYFAAVRCSTAKLQTVKWTDTRQKLKRASVTTQCKLFEAPQTNRTQCM